MVKAHIQTVLHLVSQHGPASGVRVSAGMSRGAPSVLESNIDNSQQTLDL